MVVLIYATLQAILQYLEITARERKKIDDIGFEGLASVMDHGKSPMCNNGKASGIIDLNRDRCFERGGWRSTHNRSNNVNYAAGCHFSRYNNVGCQVSQQNENRVMNKDDASEGNNRILCDSPENHGATETASVIFSKFNQISEPSRAKNMRYL
ncbi:hypothetical protein REPUB_Repub05bG0161100 [Reevesia pubescens]